MIDDFTTVPFAPVPNSSFALKPKLPDSVQWADKGKTAFLAVFDGEPHIVPNDLANADRRAIEHWLAAGNVIGAAIDAPI